MESRQLLASDFGDAPDAIYATLAASGGPSHAVPAAPLIYLGSNVDTEADGFPTADADGDDLDQATPDDEDGVFEPREDLFITEGTSPTVRLRATNETAAAATLYGWIDYDGDGSFDNATERAQIPVAAGTSHAIVTLTFPVIPAGSASATFARFRLSTDSAAANATGAAMDGEVEDYPATIVMPSTSLIGEEQVTKVDPIVSLSIWQSIAELGDVNGDGVSDLVVGDSYNFDGGNPNEERGAAFILFMNSDGTVASHQQISANHGNFPGVLDDADLFGTSVAGLGDLDGDGVPEVAIGAPGDNDGANNHGGIWVLFLNADGTVKSHQKISSTDGGFTGSLEEFDQLGFALANIGDIDGDGVPELATGTNGDDDGGNNRGAIWVLFLNADGTVKSHQKISSTVGGFTGTLDDQSDFGTSIASVGDLNGDGATDIVVGAESSPNAGLHTGALWVLFLNPDGTVLSQQKIDETNGNFGGTLGEHHQFGAAVASLGDIDGDGVTDLGVRGNETWVLHLNADGTVKSEQKINAVEAGLAGGAYGPLVRLQEASPDGLIRFAVAAGVDIWTLQFSPSLDFGDAPDLGGGTGTGDYETLSVNNGPSHVIDVDLVLGTHVGGELEAAATFSANGDTKDQAVIDPLTDLLLVENLVPTVRLVATNRTGGPATLSGWIDYNSDGVFDNATERAQAVVSDSAQVERVTLTFPPVPAGTAGTTYARFRLSTDAAAEDPTGPASDGEVEDYRVDIVTNVGAVVIDEQKIDSSISGLSGQLDLDDSFGHSVANLGDVNGDGVNDLAVGTPHDDDRRANAGAVWILFMNADGTVQAEHKLSDLNDNLGGNLWAQDRFGSSVVGLGDINGDGVPDLAVGEEGDDFIGTDRGRLWILLLNRDGTVKYEQQIGTHLGHTPPHLGDNAMMGSSLTNLGDLNGDGYTDIAVGARGETGGGAAVVLFLGSFGTVLDHQDISSSQGNFGGVIGAHSEFGSAVANVGDLDGDGNNDLAVGEQLDTDGGNGRGAVWILFLDSDGTVLREQKVSDTDGNFDGLLDDDDNFGSSLAGVGDLDGDGINDLVVGARGDDDGGTDRGALWLLLLNADGTVKSEEKISALEGSFAGPLADDNHFGNGVTSVLDLNGDGLRDLVVGSPGDVEGSVWLLSLTARSDYGDAPDPTAGTGVGNYNTRSTDNGPSHAINDRIFLGTRVDGENEALPTGGANGDDAPERDEDGLLDPDHDLLQTEGTVPNVRLMVTNDTSSAATLFGWIDYDADGVFDTSEQAQVAVPSGTVNGTVALAFPAVPAGSAGPTFARFRLSTDLAAGDPTGAAADGEVEDYAVTILSPTTGVVQSEQKIDNTSGGFAGSVDAADRLGGAVATIGDLNGDGVPDLAVGAPGDDDGGADRGAVWILFMNADGTVSSESKISHSASVVLRDGDQFGSSVTSLGDIDRDGVADLAVGAELDDSGGSDRGAVWVVFLNSDGSVKDAQKVSSAAGGFTGALEDGDFFGTAVAGLGDLNGDGVNDLAVGAEGDDDGGPEHGSIWILFLNEDGTVGSQQKIRYLSGGFTELIFDYDYFGSALASLGDVDGDGVTDLAVGSRGVDDGGTDRGAVWILSLNSNGTVSSSNKISSTSGNFMGTLDDQDRFGSALASLGDLNGDGVRDLAVGADGDDDGGTDRGAVWLLNLSSSGSVLSDQKISDTAGGFEGALGDTDNFGNAVALLGDMNGDGLPNLAVGTPGEAVGGAVWITNLQNESIIVTNTNDSGAGSLRQAIIDANANTGFDTVEFNIPGTGPHTIEPLSPLPTISDPLTIDGTTEPDFAGATPVVELNGSSAGAGVNGLTVTAGSSLVRGLAINRFGGSGILLTTSGGNTIEQNVIGTDPAGTVDLGNGSHGVIIFDAPGNVVGGLSTSDANLISGNGGHGVYITRAGSTNNDIKSNTIGLGRDGDTQIGNDGAGVRIDQDASDNHIGGSGNIISGNGASGVLIAGSSTARNLVAGNSIGTDITGLLDRGNGGSGVSIDNAPDNRIGVPGDGNLISGNTTDGIFITGISASGNSLQGNTIGLDVSGTAALPNDQNGLNLFDAPNNMLGGSAAGAGNIVSGNAKTGIFIVGSSASGNTIEGNFVGTDSAGLAAVANGQFGIVVRDAPNNTVGGSAADAGNVISGNREDGIAILNAAATGNVVIGNLVGTDVTGTADVGNAKSGILIWKAPGNRIGGLTAAERNIVSGNDLFGVRLSTSQAAGNIVQGNYFGTDITGTAALPNSDTGVQLANAQNNTIGGGGSAANVISGNGNHGVLLTGAGTLGNSVQGNVIGLDVTGSVALGNTNVGVRIADGAHDNTIGGDSMTGEGNVISANGSDGVLLVDAGTTSNTVSGNLIGTDATGAFDLGNAVSGVSISEADTNTIGGTTNGAGNVISGNGLFGVGIVGAAAADNNVQGNAIGTDITRTVDLGNSSTGVFVSAPNNFVGGAGAGAGNLISGNDFVGVRITGVAASGNRIEGNLIGTQVDGTSPLGNTAQGVRIDNAMNNDIGGTTAGAGNVIAHQSSHGVAVVGNSTGNAIQGNSMFSNGGLGIDLNLDGVTPNDTAGGSEDSDTGPNNLQNTPLLEAAILSGTDLELAYSVPSATAHAAYPLTVELYLADNTGQEGQTHLGTDTYSAAAALNSTSLTIDVTSLGVSPTSQIVATATDSAGNTSEVSAPLSVSVPLLAAESQVLSAEACRAYRGDVSITEADLAILRSGLQPIVDAGISAWQRAGLSPAQRLLLDDINIDFASLDGAYLGLTTGNTILLDSDAAGYGWYLDAAAAEYSPHAPKLLPSQAAERMDLLTVVMHEMGHVLGLEDLVDDSFAEDIMFAWLQVGQRRLA